jgi:hypothetical protein
MYSKKLGNLLGGTLVLVTLVALTVAWGSQTRHSLQQANTPFSYQVADGGGPIPPLPPAPPPGPSLANRFAV